MALQATAPHLHNARMRLHLDLRLRQLRPKMLLREMPEHSLKAAAELSSANMVELFRPESHTKVSDLVSICCCL